MILLATAWPSLATTADDLPTGSAPVVEIAAEWPTDPVDPIETPWQLGFTAYPAEELSPDGTADLDGDGRGDVVTLDRKWARPTGFDVTTKIDVYRGVTGERLWGLSRIQMSEVIPVRLGRPARPGLLVAWQTGPAWSPPTSPDRGLQVAAYDGATGNRLWRWSLTSKQHVAYRASVPAVLSNREAAADVLVGLRQRGTGLGGSTAVVHPRLVSGATGEMRSGGRPVVGVQGLDASGRMDGFKPAGWIDGDELEDFVVLTRGELIARSSKSGAELWRAVVNQRMERSDRLTFHVLRHQGDPRVDVIVLNEHCRQVSERACLDVTAVAGGAGAVRWKRSFEFATPCCRFPYGAMGDANGDGVQDLLLETRPSPHGLRLISGLTAAVLWETANPSCTRNDLPAIFVRFSDVEDDGVLDVRRVHECVDPVVEDLVSGRTGTVVTGGPLGTVALGAAVDGHGDDFAVVPEWETYDTLSVTVHDGLTRAVVWSFTRPEPQRMSVRGGHTHAADLTGDGRAEVILRSDCAEDDCVEMTVIDGATGTLLWSLLLH